MTMMSLIKKAGIAAGFVALASSSLTFLPNTASAQLGGLGKLAGGGGVAVAVLLARSRLAYLAGHGLRLHIRFVQRGSKASPTTLP